MALDNSGWIRLHRKIRESEFWPEEGQAYTRTEAWIDLLLSAHWDEEPKKVKRFGDVIEVNRGQVLTSISELAARWNWDRKKVRKLITEIEEVITSPETPQISPQKVPRKLPTRCRLITIGKYSLYQGGGFVSSPDLSPETPQISPQKLPRSTPKNRGNSKISTPLRRKKKEERNYPPTPQGGDGGGKINGGSKRLALRAWDALVQAMRSSGDVPWGKMMPEDAEAEADVVLWRALAACGGWSSMREAYHGDHKNLAFRRRDFIEQFVALYEDKN